MSTVHLWFRSGNYTLLGHLDVAPQTRGRLGVVIVPPFGWEDVCSYRPLRFVARRLAQSGIPTLRYDLPGTGDSSGDAQDTGLFDAWVRSVEDAAAELRRSAGVEEVAVLGIHLGAMLAMVAASRDPSLSRLVLWGPAAKGRTLLRELRATVNMERWEYLAEEDAPPQPLPGFEAGGFLIAPETLRAIEELDVSTLPWQRRESRVLLLSRDDLPHDSSLLKLLQDFFPHGEMARGRGYSAMMAAPHEALVPQEATTLITEFLGRSQHSPHMHSPRRSEVVARASHGHASESVYRVHSSGKAIFGILTEPAPGVARDGVCLLFLNAGGMRHTGPNRTWVESARRWAERGIPSLRLDLEGIGESDGEQGLDVPSLYRERLVTQLGIVIDSLRRRAGMKHFVVVGLCSGACWGFHAAIRYPEVRAAILVNPSLLYWDPEVDRRRILPHFASGLAGWMDWAKMAASGIRRGGIGHVVHAIAERFGRAGLRGSGYIQLESKTLEQTWSAFGHSGKKVTLVFREGEPLLTELEATHQLPANTIRVPNGGHTFRPLWAQKLLHDLIDRELAVMLRTDTNHSRTTTTHAGPAL